MPVIVGRSFAADDRFGDDGTHLDEVVVVGCTFVACGLDGAALFSASFVDCTFDGVSLYWCHAFRARFVGCRFERCDLRGNFDEAVFVRCRFAACATGPNELGGVTRWRGAAAIDCECEATSLPLAPPDGPRQD